MFTLLYANIWIAARANCIWAYNYRYFINHNQWWPLSVVISVVFPKYTGCNKNAYTDFVRWLLRLDTRNLSITNACPLKSVSMLATGKVCIFGKWQKKIIWKACLQLNYVGIPICKSILPMSKIESLAKYLIANSKQRSKLKKRWKLSYLESEGQELVFPLTSLRNGDFDLVGTALAEFGLEHEGSEFLCLKQITNKVPTY